MLPSIRCLMLVYIISSCTTPTALSPITPETAAFPLYPYPIAKPGCEDRCGNVSIPFPFGTREGCYLDIGFYIQCLNSSNGVDPPHPVLKYSPINVTEISLDGQLRVLNFVGYDCYSNNVRSKSNNPWISIPVPLIFNSKANKFTAIGCDTYAFVQGKSNLRNYSTGCLSICNPSEVYDSCSGVGCCQTPIPDGAWEINVTMNSFWNYSNFSKGSSKESCTYAFVVEDKAFKFAADNLTSLADVWSLPIVVDWVVAYENCTVAQQNSTSYACRENSVCEDPDGALGYRCRCNEGYEGNPYLSDGCRGNDFVCPIFMSSSVTCNVSYE